MRRLNLLPWRQKQRQIRDRRIIVVGLSVLLLCICSTAARYGNAIQLKTIQDRRNDLLADEISRLDQNIVQLQRVLDDHNQVEERLEEMRAIVRLRTRTVRSLGELTNRLPSTVAYDQLRKEHGKLRINGRARSALMVYRLTRNLTSSKWLTQVKLEFVNSVIANGNRISEFEITAVEKHGF